MMSVLVEQLINITDAIFLGHVGAMELGASAIAGMYYLCLYILGFGFSLGLQVMIARRNGEQCFPETGKVFFQGLFFLCGLGSHPFQLIPNIHPVPTPTFIDIPGGIRCCHTIFKLAYIRPALCFSNTCFPGIFRGDYENPHTYGFRRHPRYHKRVIKLPAYFRYK